MPQHHAIRRQIVEVTVANAATAERISPLISELVRNAVMPLLERVFDDLTPHAEIVRVDRLELDLGRMALGSLQQELPGRIASTLPAAVLALAAAAPRHGGNKRPGTSADSARSRPDADAAALLVINHFARTGTLPWWCDIHERDVLDRAAEGALLRSPADLIRGVRDLVADPTGMNRLVAHLTDQSLHMIAAALAPASVALMRELATLFDTASLGSLTPRQRRLVVWRGLLHAACADVQSDFVQAALTATAVAAGLPLASVVAAYETALAEQPPSVIQARTIGMEHVPSALHPSEPLAESAHGIGSLDRAFAALHAELAPLARRLPEPGQQAWIAAFERLARAPAGTSSDSAISALLRPLLDAGLLASAVAERLRAQFSHRAPPTHQHPQQQADTEDSHAVAAAGMCLLWPFLTRFFARRGLLDENETVFASLVAQQRAVLLLHHLATGEHDAPEFSLMLPKVLCGMPPFDPCEIIEPVTDAEDAEAGRLLDAAIAHADCLGTISQAGLRETFLKRQGVLATRDGAWLLRLERRSADVLIERIPWTLQWFRLPWMRAAMRVEW